MNRMNAQKSQQLGQPFSQAAHKLRKTVMFNLIQKLGLDICFHCRQKILHSDHLSIEHKIPWLYSSNPLELFFDLGNIAFSHRHCNSKSRRRKSLLQSTSGYKGVRVVTDKRHKKRWEAKIYVNTKEKSLGHFHTPEEAAHAYDKAALVLLKDKAITNRSLGLL